MAKRGTNQTSDIRLRDTYGYAYAETGRDQIMRGIVPSLDSATINKILSELPTGVLLRNTDTNQVIITTSQAPFWEPLGGGQSGAEITIGVPTDGDLTDGAVTLNSGTSLADAIDLINQFLKTCECEMIASHLGTTDGTSNGVLATPSFITGRVSSPTIPGTPYYTLTWDDDTNRDLTSADTIVWQLAGSEQITDLHTGTITARFYDGSTSTGTLIHTETLVPDGTIIDQISSPSGYLEINNLEQLSTVIQGRLDTTIDINTLLEGDNSGYIRVELEHVVTSSTYSQTLEFFRDTEGLPSVVAGDAVLSSSPEKFLSGVSFATTSGATNPELLITASVNDMWKDTYRADPFRVLASNLGVPNFTVNYNSNTVTKNSVSPPASPFYHDEDFEYSEVVEITSSTLLNPDANGNFATMNFIARDPFGQSASTPFAPELLINTQTANSTDVRENFFDEEYRLLLNSGTSALSSIDGAGRGALEWDSTESLATASGLQVINGALVYPQEDFSVYEPSGSPDYTSLSGSLGDLSYVRRMRDPLGTARANGIIRIVGLSEADRVAGNILVDIRVVGPHIPGNGAQGPGNTGTGWLSLNTDYNIATFLGDDGDGCFVTTGGEVAPNFEFTLGGFSTAFAENQAIEVRVTYKNPAALSKRITLLHITNWNQ